MITDPVDKAYVLAEFFFSISRCGIHKTPIDINNINDTAKKIQNNKQIELIELDDALAKSKDSSPGGDHIPYFLLRALPMRTKLELLSIYNHSFQQGEIPKAWKFGIVIPILKPGKNSSEIGRAHV